MNEAIARIRTLLLDAALPDKAASDRRRSLISERFSFDLYCADLVRILKPDYRMVSVIVPSYNYARYLDDRLRSIFDQHYPVFEIIVIDDCSQDDSVPVARRAAEEAGRTILLQPGATNSGNVFRQWKKGLDQARGEFVWIAEADDLCDKKFLGEMMRRLVATPEASFAFSDSRSVASDGSQIYDNYKGYYHQFGDHGLDQDGRFEAGDFLQRFLTIRNNIVNASSVVWRTESLRRAFDTLGDEAFKLSCAGDWRIYVEACRQAKEVVYVADPLNCHRRHEQSVTHALANKDHMREIIQVQDDALKGVARDSSLRLQAKTWLLELRKVWGLDTKVA